MSAQPESAPPGLGVDELFGALQKTDRACRLIVKQLRESHPNILEGPELERLVLLARRQFRDNRELLGTGPPANEPADPEPSAGTPEAV